MKTLHISILAGLGIVVIGIALVFFQPNNPTFEERLGNPTQTWLAHDGAILLLNQTSNKPEYKVGENITISTELINVGDKSVDIGYWPPLVVLEIKDKNGALVWPENTNLMAILEFYGVETIRPGEHLGEKPWGHGNFTYLMYKMPLPQLHVPGKYTVVSMALFTFNMTTDGHGHREPTGLTTQLWSKPIQITVLP
ncbi:protein of unknown function [Nitrosotalea devaniterrae]|uniref:Intracellular proteinase inhibitor BsuPI domain-containing protein n=1 Tax=Nitrosotalea devaniterrae TaxID=1078905 RepID=A0A128A4M4_9ARCH|nr:protein of unknown function [Candidatus Nitrosotalea devanaterra]